ncbi:MAG: hypothetical protein EOS11_10295 [Mesorhizobium sp.]|nr:MAG: hypothetical protein EOS11_10295 [Mesorhizobium sp.]
MQAASAEIDANKSKGRSAVSNGSAILPGVDGRSPWARRFRDLIVAISNDQGGDDQLPEAKRLLIRNASGLATELERMLAKWAVNDGATPEELALFGGQSKNLRILLDSVGLERAAKDVTPTLGQWMAQKAAEKAGAEK